MMKNYEEKKKLERSLYESGISYSSVGKEIANILSSYSGQNLSSNTLDVLIRKIKDYIKKNENEYLKLVEEISKLKADYNMKKDELRKYISQIEEEYLKRGAIPPLDKLKEMMKVGVELRNYEERIKKMEERKQLIKYSSEIGKMIYKILENSKEKIDRGQKINGDDLISYIYNTIKDLFSPTTGSRPHPYIPVYIPPDERGKIRKMPVVRPLTFPSDEDLAKNVKKKRSKDTEELLEKFDKLEELYKKRSKEEEKARILGITILLLSSTLFISHLLNISSRGMFASIPIFNYFTLSITFLMLIVFMFFVISLNKKYKL